MLRATELLQNLPKKDRERLAKYLAASNYYELLGVLGAEQMQRFVGYPFSWSEEGDLQCAFPHPQGRDPTWISFEAWDGDICFSCANPPKRRLSYVFGSKAILALLAHFELPVEDPNPNNPLVELRDIGARLSILKLIKDPLVQEYLKAILNDLCEDQSPYP